MQNVTPVDINTPDRITAALKQNLRKVVEVSECEAFCATAGDAVKVVHALGRTPNYMNVVPFVDGRWWVDPDDEKSWSEKIVVFHASSAGRYRVFVGRV